MRKDDFKKSMILAIIGLFIGAGIIPQIVTVNNTVVTAAILVDCIDSPGDPRGLAWDGNYLCCDSGDTIYKLNPSNGNVINSIPHSVPQSRGLTWDGQHFWIVGNYGYKYKINPANGSIIDTISGKGHSGLTWDGNYLWCTGGSGSFNNIYQIDPSDGSNVDQRYNPCMSPWGLAMQGVYIWSADHFTGKIWMLHSQNPMIQTSFLCPGDDPPQGLTWDGSYLWVGIGESNQIYKINPNKYPPDTPEKPTGTTIGYPSTLYYYETQTEDPDNDDISYGWDWNGDNVVDEWTGFYPSGVSISIPHFWEHSGTYVIKVKAEDRDGAISAFSEFLEVTISDNFPPTIPNKPQGREEGWINEAYSFRTSATDSEDNQIRYGWDWDGDDVVDEWTDYYSSGVSITYSHMWQEPGIYEVQVLAEDSEGAKSGWSESLTVIISLRSDLECIGDIYKNGIEPGSTTSSTIIIRNTGDPESNLNWEIISYPEWGNWTFNPESGSNLKPIDSDVYVDVEIDVPNEKGQTFDGEVIILNNDNENDVGIIPVRVITPKYKVNISPFFSFLQQHPHLFSMLRYILDL